MNVYRIEISSMFVEAATEDDALDMAIQSDFDHYIEAVDPKDIDGQEFILIQSRGYRNRKKTRLIRAMDYRATIDAEWPDALESVA